MNNLRIMLGGLFTVSVVQVVLATSSAQFVSLDVSAEIESSKKS